MGEKEKKEERRREKGKNRQGKEPDYRRDVRARGHEEDRQRRQNVIMNQLDAELLPYLVMRLNSSSQTDVLSRLEYSISTTGQPEPNSHTSFKAM